ncbi:hypothetical protein HELRODRAFT_86902 [Helobdella robusta]|uniref:Mitochondrial ribosomal protein S21 n=1 Tax=Helobdella robusta TaxID=6412 RepID=T1G6I9_HELRO|nr:hypothetical protein HELRODRAFT_86902 [Helobdella robusta]ESN95418.1 hypothetical protein HELRODRAFT_86902 [Helobdella robusta]
MAHHAKFFARTVLVRNNDVDTAYKALDKILRNDKVLERARRNMYYEKPYQLRKRVSLERCKRIYNSEMKRKIEFVMKTFRPSPWIA